MTPRQEAQHSHVKVIAPARLHLGFLDPDGVMGRKFASVGLAVSAPSTKLTIQRAETTTCTGAEQERTSRLVARFQSALQLDGDYAITVDNAIPPHAGLGSGTQLALALGAGLQTLANRPVNAAQLGAIVSRGARSAIGIASFERGGFIVDGGKKDASHPPPVLSRINFPEHWRIVLALDHQAQGIHGDDENHAFAELKPLPQTTAAHLCHLTLLQMLPALHDCDLKSFGTAVTEMQTIIGEYFAPAQGGSAYSSPRVASIVNKMGALGGCGLGQSSWGPTGFAVVESAEIAERVYTTLVEDAKASDVQLMIVAGRNTGAQISPVLA